MNPGLLKPGRTPAIRGQRELEVLDKTYVDTLSKMETGGGHAAGFSGLVLDERATGAIGSLVRRHGYRPLAGAGLCRRGSRLARAKPGPPVRPVRAEDPTTAIQSAHPLPPLWSQRLRQLDSPSQIAAITKYGAEPIQTGENSREKNYQ